MKSPPNTVTMALGHCGWLPRRYSDRMVQWGDRPCPDCGAARHHDVSGVCGPALPAAFYDDPRLTAALARLDFGPVFRRVSAEKHWSQTALGGLLGLDQAAISKIENGRRRLTEATIIIRVANVLGIPAGKLGFRHGVTVEPTGQKGGWGSSAGIFWTRSPGSPSAPRWTPTGSWPCSRGLSPPAPATSAPLTSPPSRAACTTRSHVPSATPLPPAGQ
jgi:transcriptional regulator with XRE-family HTH domain